MSFLSLVYSLLSVYDVQLWCPDVALASREFCTRCPYCLWQSSLESIERCCASDADVAVVGCSKVPVAIVPDDGRITAILGLQRVGVGSTENSRCTTEDQKSQL